MESLDIIIGEHSLRISFGSANVKMLFHYTFPTVLKGINCEPIIHVHLNEGYGQPFTDYQIAKQATLRGCRYIRTDYVIEAEDDLRSVRIDVHDSLSIKHAFMHFYSLLIVHDRWGLLIHSSCIAENGNAHMFAGHSGAGKSTAAALSLPRGIIADEAAIMRIRPDGVSVFHSPFRSELQSMAAEESMPWPLAAIHLLHQAKHHQRIRLTKSEGLLRLLDKVFFWNPSIDESRNIIHMLMEAADLVPLYDLHFCKDPEFWELIS